MYGRLQLLVVDDDDVDRMATRRALQAADLDADVHEAPDAPAAIELLRGRSVDCVLTDYHLARGDGLALLHDARALGLDCPFVVLTSQGHEQIAVEMMKAGATDYLLKSQASPERLGQAVRQATRVHHAERLRSDAQERQRNYAAQLKGLAEASLAINSSTTLEQLLEVLTRKAGLLVGAHQATTRVTLGASGSPTLTAHHLSEKYAHVGEQFSASLARGAARLEYEPNALELEVQRSNQPLRLSEAELKARLESAEIEPPARAWLAAPLVRRDGQNLGVVWLSDRYEGDFNEEDEAILVQLARFASLSVENTNLLAREQRARQHAEASAARIGRLQAVTAALSQPASVREVMEVMVEQTVAVLGVQSVAVYLVDPEAQELRLCAQRNLSETALTQVRQFGIDQPFLSAKCVRLRRAIFVESLAEYEREAMLAARAGIWTERTRSVLCAPLQLSDAAPFGAVAMNFAHARTFDEEERAYFESLVDQWAQAIDRARLHDAERFARKQAELAREQAETANRLKDEFLATISHELRTPLQSMLGWARLLRGDALEPRTAKGLEIIERNARAQARLIEDILDVSRIITGKLRLNVREVSIESVVQAAVDTLRAAAEAKNIALTVKIEPGLNDILGDPDRLQQVVWNLLSNAVKFTPAHGRIEVIGEGGEDEVKIGVHDSGRGIAPEFLPHVFERFRQADASTTRAQSGLGLGLAIVRYLSELHGGRVSAHSAGLDLGASFLVRLPLRGALPAPPADEPAAVLGRVSVLEPTLALARRRILVVDDEADARELVATVLMQAGAHVVSAVSAAEAIEKLAELRPEVVISDIAMPGEDGFALLRRVRGLEPPLCDVPVFALTAFARSEDKSRILRAGFVQHLAKPIDPQLLLTTLARLFAAGS